MNKKETIEAIWTLVGKGKFEDVLYMCNHLIKQGEIDPDILFAKANALNGLQRHSEVLNFCNYITEQGINHFYVPILKSITLFNLMRYDEALELSNQLIEQGVNHSDVLRTKAITLVQLKKHDEALEFCDQLIEQGVNHLDIICAKVNILNNLERHDEALRICNQLIEQGANRSDILIARADALNGLKKYDEALKICNQLIEQGANHPDVLRTKANALSYLEKYDEALNLWNQLIEQGVNHPDILIARADTLNGLKKYDEALKICNQLIEQGVNHSNITGIKAITLIQLKKYDEALEFCDHFIEQGVSYPDILTAKADALSSLKRYDELLYFCNYLFKQGVNYPSILCAEIYALNGLKRHNQALEICNQLIKQGVDYPNILCAKANTLYSLKRYTKALEFCKYLIKQDVDHPDIPVIKANTLNKLSGYNAALEICNQLIEQGTSSLTVLVAKANALNGLQRHDKALEICNKIVKQDPSNLSILVAKAIALNGLQKHNEALKYCLHIEVFMKMPLSIYKKTRLLPFFIYRKLTSYQINSEEIYYCSSLINRSYDASKHLSLYSKYLSIKSRDWAMDKKRCTFWQVSLNYLMGDYIVCHKICLNEIRDNSNKDLSYFYYLFCAGSQFLRYDEKIGTLAILLSEELINKQEDGKYIDERQLYYAGHIFILFRMLQQSLKCFSAIEESYIPANYMATWLRKRLNQKEIKSNKLEKILSQNPSNKNFSKNIKTTFINIHDEKFWGQFETAINYYEIQEAIDFASTISKNVVPSYNQKPFYDLWKLSESDIVKINETLRKEEFRKIYISLYERVLEPLSTAQKEKISIKEIEELLNKADSNECLMSFNFLKSQSESGLLIQRLGNAITRNNLDANYYMLFNYYFFMQGNISCSEMWKLNFYAILPKARSFVKDDVTLDISIESVKRLIENQLGSLGIGTSTGFLFSSSPFEQATITIGTIIAAQGLASLFGVWLKANRIQFSSYNEFSTEFEVFIGNEFDRLGEQKFFKKYSIEGIGFNFIRS